MKGGGYYDAHSKEQRSALEAFLPWIEEAIADLPILSDSQESLGILDIGSSEGGNAIYAMNRLISGLRCISSLPIGVFFNDLPTNDFNHLFKNLYPDGEAALSGTNIFPSAIGGTAYGRIVPPQSLHIATTFNTIGWLEKKPDARLPNYILPMGPGPLAPRESISVSETERAPFRIQAADDLHRFYTARADELVNGGKLLVQVFGRDERFSTSDGLYDVLSDSVLNCVEEGTLPLEVYEKLVFPIYFRNLEELLAPIATDAQLAKSFRIDKAETCEVSVPFNVALSDNGDIAAWSRSYTGFLRAFTEAILASALPGDLPLGDTLDKIYHQVEHRLAADPARYEFHYISIAALLTRV
ncbi:cyclopropane-fatty-acyl-phospholipid synthase [Methyloprofundus sedimenti]|uniref:Cyclopropane-fatty-acyl-phospholipid synthase n=2 Tax=Methyloprofundus sedimenti TaxID=1420851 RepID=A0A1V8MB41_9GAMM|nr:cyclopropane-fatty-acyl-phospholipid synthase [Methyloprofundus sedimenti]